MSLGKELDLRLIPRGVVDVELVILLGVAELMCDNVDTPAGNTQVV